MNLYGSYRILLNNSKAAMMAAIEIYNKPQMVYRDECFSILLINAWELFLKATLSKNRVRIYYPKKRKEVYKTLSLTDAMKKAAPFFPAEVLHQPVSKNVESLTTYRDNSIHFYNEKGFSILIYGLAQTSINNFRDLMRRLFNIDLADEITIMLLPLAFGTPPDPIEFLQKMRANPPKDKVVAQYLKEISDITKQLEDENIDTGRFLTTFTISLQSVKKITSADIIAGVVTDPNNPQNAIIIERVRDPNDTHPLRRTDIVRIVGNEINGARFTTHTFDVIVWRHNIREQPRFHWRPTAGGTSQYSRDFVTFIKGLSRDNIEAALIEHLHYQREKKKESLTVQLFSEFNENNP